MFVRRNLTKDHLITWLPRNIIVLLIFNSIVAYAYALLDQPVELPWLPVSVVGTAVAFFIGFKNNQAYDRVWEARKIWGGIVNDSRTWGMRINNFVRPKENIPSNDLKAIKRRLIRRHIAWMYAHRSQLLIPTSWEQVGSRGLIGKIAKNYTRKFGLGIEEEDIRISELDQFIAKEELEYLNTVANPATQLLDMQSREVMELKDKGLIDEFEHKMLEELLQNFFTLQGQNERIKKFPFLRDYSTMSRFFVYVFITLLPFSLIPEMIKEGDWAFWLSVPIATLIGLLFMIMEDLGDYNENPFMGTPNGMPMLSISRAIEIDLLQIVKDDSPKSIEPKNGVLM